MRGVIGFPAAALIFFSFISQCQCQATFNAIKPTLPVSGDQAVSVQSGNNSAEVSWDLPNNSSGFQIKVERFPLSESDADEEAKNVPEVFHTRDQNITLNGLTPGATYEVQVHSLNKKQESTVYISTNFTTKPNTPGRFQVWFRNETTLLILWQPPFPFGTFNDYKVSICPEDALLSETYVPNDFSGGPAQAAFNGLVPGRVYNISVQTVSNGQTSDPNWARYRTVPLRPHNVTFDQIGPDFFSVRWSGPTGISEFDRYQVAIGTRRKNPQIIEKGQPLVARFAENLTPGQTYQVVVKTVSGSVASWPAVGNVTTTTIRPLPVTSIREEQEAGLGSPVSVLTWQPDSRSHQDSYKIEYTELMTGGLKGDSSSVTVEDPRVYIGDLKPGRNYSIAIRAVSNGMESEPTLYSLATSETTKATHSKLTSIFQGQQSPGCKDY